MKKNSRMILGKDEVYSMDCYTTKRNNNVMVVGASGAGKTRGIVCPNIMEAVGSYIVSDPKGTLYSKYKGYLEKKGYKVKKLDFTDPLNSVHYNFLSYIREPIDIVKAAHMLVSEEKCNQDPFWDQSSDMLLSSVIAYCIETLRPDEMNFNTIQKLLQSARRNEYSSDSRTDLDKLMEYNHRSYPDCWSYKQFANVNCAPDRTFNSILISLTAKLRNYNTEEIAEMMRYDEVEIAKIGQEKTALFVVVSDTDRSMDNLANLFFTQAMNELCRFADKEREDYRLPIPVRFILDDFATNCRIDEFPRMISSIRSRNISTMLMIQAESQLLDSYGPDGRTILGNCDTYIYLGGSDIETARAVAERCDVPLKKILNMQVGKNIILRRGDAPVYGEVIDLDAYERDEGFKYIPTVDTKAVDTRPLKERLTGKRGRHSRLEEFNEQYGG